MNRVDVLEKVKGLLLLPNLEMATTQQVADFYNVNPDVIRHVYKKHREELLTDGFTAINGRELFDEFLESETNSLTKLTRRKGGFMLDWDGNNVKLTYGKTTLFPRRAILRVGMLLRDSAIAKEVRLTLRVIALCDCD